MAAEIAILAAAEELTFKLIQEAAVLRGVEEQVDWIQKELRLMLASLEHVERLGGQSKNVIEWADEVENLACDANEVIDSFIKKSKQQTRRGAFKRFVWQLNYTGHRYRFGRKLKRIQIKIVNVSERRKNHENIDARQGLNSVIQSLQEGSSSVNTISMEETTASPVIQKLNHLLHQEFLVHQGVIKVVEEVRDDFACMHDIMKDIEFEERDEREKVWIEEVREVCCLTENVVDNFMKKMEHLNQRGVHVGALKHSAAESKFCRKMEQIKTKIQAIFKRKWTYGIGKTVKREESILTVSRIGWKRKAFRRLEYSCLLLSFFCFPYCGPEVLICCLPFFLEKAIRLLHLWRPVNDRVETIRRNLRLMHALFKDVEGMDYPNERVKVWVQEMRLIAQDAEALDQYVNQTEQAWKTERHGIIFKELKARPKIAREIKQIMKKIHDMSERKQNYDIKHIKGRTSTSSMVQSLQEKEPSTSDADAIQEICDLGEDRPTSSAVEEDNSSIPENMTKPLHLHSTKGVEQKVESVRAELRLMNALFKDAEGMEELDERLKAWLEEMRELAREAEAVIKIYVNKVEQKKKGSFKRYVLLPNVLLARFEVERKIKKIKKKIHDISDRRIAYGNKHIEEREESNSMVQSLHQRRLPSFNVEPDIIGFNDDVSAMMSQLLADDQCRSIISIVGMEGIGKTALAKLIYNNNAIVDHFPCRAWVSAPQQYSARALLLDIEKQLTAPQELKGKQIVKEEGIQMLNAPLKYLIVLDDVQTTQVWDSLKEAIPDTLNGSRIVLTTRNINIALHADPERFPHQLRLLSIAESRELFTHSLKTSISPELQKIGEEIVIKCGGLPLAILKIGKLLSEKDATCEEWSEVLEQLNRHQRPWLETMDRMIEDLPLYLKRCLDYFQLFPANFEIPARRLIVLWVAEGLVRQKEDDKEPPEYLAERYLTELIDRNMIQVTKKKPDGKVKTCSLPDALQALLLSKANEDKFLRGRTEASSKSASSISIRRLADHLDKEDASYDHIHGNNTNTSTFLRPYYRDVLSFLSFDMQEGSKPGDDIGNFLCRCISSQCFQLLRVLDLEHVFRPKLPHLIGELSQLRYLGLRWTYIEMLPSSISKLLKLQTLDVKHTYISTLPCSIWKMQQLRHLYLSESYRSRFAPRPRGGYLTDLQTLWGVFIDEESPVKDGLDSLVNLRKLGLACRLMMSQHEAMLSQLEAVAEWVLKLEKLESLRLRSNDKLGQPWDLPLKPLSGHMNLTRIYLLGRLRNPSIVSEFPQSLIDLTLSASGLFEDPMQILDKLPNLRTLKLFSESYVGENMLCHSGGFPQLRILKLWKLEQLEDWTVEEGALPVLRDLEIRSCRSLKMLPDGLQHVRTLHELKLSNMPEEFTERIKDNQGEDWDKVAHIRNIYKEYW